MALTVSAAITDIDLTIANISQIVTAIRASVKNGVGGAGTPIVPAHIYGVSIIPLSNTMHRIVMIYD